MPFLRRRAARAAHPRPRPAATAVPVGLRAAVAAVAIGAGLAAAAPATAATPKVPKDFFGVQVDGPVLDGTVPIAGEMAKIRAARISLVRGAFSWHEAQPYENPNDVPADEAFRYRVVDGIAIDFTATDRLVGAAADAGLEVLPVVFGSPRWAADGGRRTPNVPPKSAAAYARYLSALVKRYGRDGEFWEGRPAAQRRTIRGWQVWNEPSLPNFWTQQPFAKRYTALLRTSYRAVKRVEPQADVYLAGMTSGADVPAWTALRRVYQAGGRRSFDVIALHPYTKKPSGVLEVVRRARAEARRYGDARKPLALTELSFSSSNGDTTDRFATWDTTERTQALRASQVMRAIATKRRAYRIELANWYTWLSPQVSKVTWPGYAGLSKVRDGKVVEKPALGSLTRVIRALRR